MIIWTAGFFGLDRPLSASGTWCLPAIVLFSASAILREHQATRDADIGITPGSYRKLRGIKKDLKTEIEGMYPCSDHFLDVDLLS